MKPYNTDNREFRRILLPENSRYDGVLIQGDNALALQQMQSLLVDKIKCIYIDPPYNNGESYHYYCDKMGHDQWLAWLRQVLLLLKPLLTNDGSIWISIDDREMAYLKVESDKVFGRENFVGTIIWQQLKSRENRAVFSCNHEYILVYAKDAGMFKRTRKRLPVGNDFIKSKYRNPDNDPRGLWQSVSANVQAGHAVPSQFYTIESPAGVKHVPPKGRCWVYGEERMKREIANGNVWFGKDGRNSPRIKKFLRDAKIGLTPETIWLADEVGTSDSAKKQLKALFPDVDKVFETPKPEGLLKRIMEIASDEGDYVLDCFLGSGSTVAVAHKMHRRYIGIEIGRQMADIAVRRMNMVVCGDQTGISSDVGWCGGGDFLFQSFCRVGEEIEIKQCASQKPHIVYPTKSEQLRLAIEKKKPYKGNADKDLKRGKSKLGNDGKVHRPKSVKARYAKNG